MLSKQRIAQIKAIMNNHFMSGDRNKKKYWLEEMITLVNTVSEENANRTKVVERVIYIDKTEKKKQQDELLNKILYKK